MSDMQDRHYVITLFDKGKEKIKIEVPAIPIHDNESRKTTIMGAMASVCEALGVPLLGDTKIITKSKENK